MVKLIGQVLMTVSLIAGAYAASTAYHVRLDLPADHLEGLTLRDDVGVSSAAEGLTDPAPVANRNTQLTPALVEQLRALRRADGTPAVARVRVREFAFSRWHERWLFALSLPGLLLGAYLAKRGRLAKAASSEAASAASPEVTLAAITKGLDALLSELDKTKNAAERMSLVLARVEALQRSHVAAFVDSRPQLVARFGIGGMAELMDQFAVAERQMNRAWTAACDAHEAEALTSLKAARPLLNPLLAKLQSGAGGTGGTGATS
jgi:hypothetical protein